MKIILASGSPRRSEILSNVGIPFEKKVSGKEEVITGSDPKDVVRELSYMKASDVAGKETRDAVVIGADTVVAYDKKILGKPESVEEAASMLQMLQGRVHSVFTGVSIIKKEADQQEERSFYVETKVTLTPMTMKEIHAYAATGEPLDKAGAYAIQGKFAPFIDKIDGDYYNVVGLPISRIVRELKDMMEDFSYPF